MHTTHPTWVRCAAAPGSDSGEGCGVSERVCSTHAKGKCSASQWRRVHDEETLHLREDAGDDPVPEGRLKGGLAPLEVQQAPGT